MADSAIAPLIKTAIVVESAIRESVASRFPFARRMAKLSKVQRPPVVAEIARHRLISGAASVGKQHAKMAQQETKADSTGGW